jgi:hypothetical protein
MTPHPMIGLLKSSVNPVRAGRHREGGQMGNYFSTRWNFTVTRQTTGGRPFLDAATLRRMGGLTPGAVANLRWTDGRGQRIGAIRTVRSGDNAAPVLTLVYYARTDAAGAWTEIRERICLDATPCAYGGERLWFTCPDCRHRRRVLYCHRARFRCRPCHDLAYPSTRENAHDRSIRRETKLQTRLGASRDGLFCVPDKPRGMHWHTYERAVVKLLEEHDVQADAFRAFLAKREALLACLDGAWSPVQRSTCGAGHARRGRSVPQRPGPATLTGSVVSA